MKIFFLISVVFPLFFSAASEQVRPSAEGSPVEVMVIADRVNLRNAGSLDSDVIGQVNFGDRLMALEFTEEWVRVRAPETLAVWVHGGLLFEDREVRARVLNMRSGPGTQFDVLGQLERLDAVTVLERYDEWRRIQPTDAVQVWIFRELLLVPEAPDTPEAVEPEAVEPEAEPESEAPAADTPDVVEPDAVEPEAPAAEAEDLEWGGVDAELEAAVAVVEVEAPEEVVPEEVVPEEVVPMPEDVPLVPLAGQGTASVRRGWVKAYLIAGTAPSRFHLVFRERGREESLAYLRGNEDEIRALVGQQVLVRGRDFWVAGQRIPLTRIESIEPVTESAQ